MINREEIRSKIDEILSDPKIPTYEDLLEAVTTLFNDELIEALMSISPKVREEI